MFELFLIEVVLWQSSNEEGLAVRGDHLVSEDADGAAIEFLSVPLRGLDCGSMVGEGNNSSTAESLLGVVDPLELDDLTEIGEESLQ